MNHSIDNFNKDLFNADIVNDLINLMKDWAKNIPDFPLDYDALTKITIFDDLEKSLPNFPQCLAEEYGDNFYDEVLQRLFAQSKLSIAEKLRLMFFEGAGKGDLEKGCNMFIKAYLTNKSLYEVLYNKCQIFRRFVDGMSPQFKAEFKKGRSDWTGGWGILKAKRAISTVGISLLTDKLVDSAFDAAFGIKSKGAEIANDPMFRQMIFIFIESKLWQDSVATSKEDTSIDLHKKENCNIYTLDESPKQEPSTVADIKEDKKKPKSKNKKTRLITISCVLVVLIILAIVLPITLTPGLKYEKYGDGYIVTGTKGIKQSEIIIPERHNGKPVIGIGTQAFEENDTLSSITIPSSVTSIGDGAFNGCTSLLAITIPSSVNEIGSSAFYNTGIWNNTSTGNVVYADKWAVGLSGTSSENIILKLDTIGISENAFSSKSITSIRIPSNVLYINSYAFSSHSSLTIYAQVSAKPTGWSSNWNPGNRPVVWGYNN